MDISKRIEKVNNTILKDLAKQHEEGGGEQIAFTDTYRSNFNDRYNEYKRQIPNGSSPKLLVDLQAVVKDLAVAYNKAKDDSDVLSSRGDKQRAEMVKQQYTEEKFLPAVDAIINFNSADELLNSKKALDELDKYAIIGANGKGYTASYVASAYADKMGEYSGTSDCIIRDGLKRIKMLIAKDQIRSAYGVASDLKRKIDNGENKASQEDYELIQRVIVRGN